MAEKSGKKKKGKADANVLGSLPSTRPSKLGRRSREGGAATVAKPARKPRAKRKPTAAKAKPKAAAAAAAKLAAPKAQPVAAPKAQPADVASSPRPKPVRSASKNLAKPAAKSAVKRAPAPDKPPSGTELVTTVVQAAGELASVGLSIGGQIVKRAVDRLPKP